MKSLLGIGLLSIALATSCNNASKTVENTTDSIKLKALTNDTTAARVQLFLGFTNESETDSSKIFICKSLNGTDTVGLKVEVLKNIKPGINNDGNPIEAGFAKGSIKLSSIGNESNNFIVALGQVFKLPSEGVMTSETIEPTVFSSNKGLVEFNNQNTYSFKLFLDNGLGEPAEMFAVLDLYRRAFELSEKEAVYRPGIIAAFEGK